MKLNAQAGIRFRCDCSRERLRRVLMGIQEDELTDIIETDKKQNWYAITAIKIYILH